jgi:4-phospho-D-threonate 3-dehydrogenase / 4-phospho-D-erythronate 3-dehydrogenase
MERLPREFQKPIGITIGDPAGIGPEIVLKAVASHPSIGSRVLLIGDLEFLSRTASELDLDISLVPFAENFRVCDHEVPVHDMANLPGSVAPGLPAPECGMAAGEYIERAVELWRNGTIRAISTAPISKQTLALGGYSYPGHTEFLAELTGTRKFAMSFFAGDLRVVLLSTHVSLSEAISLVKRDRLNDLIVFVAEQFRNILGREPRLAVAGLNPHASEGGKFGNEEAEEMVPAIEDCKGSGIDVSGPFSADTIFLRGSRGEFDAVIACYHDQATIAVKSLAFGNAVNVTLGLPLIRTSVDHGTAFDIAGKGIADHSSMLAAIKLATELAEAKEAAIHTAIS